MSCIIVLLPGTKRKARLQALHGTVDPHGLDWIGIARRLSLETERINPVFTVFQALETGRLTRTAPPSFLSTVSTPLFCASSSILPNAL